jgi:predicted nucleic acid-binding Zn ribbon protein
MSRYGRKGNEKSIRDLLATVFDDYRIAEKLREVALRTNWEEVAGPMVAKYTQEITLRNGVLKIRVNSAPLREELQYMKEQLLAQANEELKERAVKKVVVC